MWIYTAPFCAFLSLSLLSPFLKRREVQFLVGAMVLACIAFAGLRFRVDNDWDAYLEIFSSIPSATKPSALLEAMSELYLEPPFIALVAVLQLVLPHYAVFAALAALSLGVYFVSFAKVAKYPAVAFLMYLGDGYYLREFTQIRFGLAVSIGLASLVALHLGSRWTHRSLAVLASCMHVTGLVLLACRSWTRHVCTRRRVVAVATALFALYLSGLFNGVVDSLITAGFAPLRLLSYVDSEEESAAARGLVVVAQYLLVLVSVYVVRDDDPQFFWVSVYALSFALVCVFSGFDLMRRLSFYFSTALYVLASIALVERRYVVVLVFVSYAAAFLAARFSILQPYATWAL
jgi:hypothetical protein